MSVKEIAERILEEMGGDAYEICSGQCTKFARYLIEEVGKGEVVSNLSLNMLGDIEGLEIIEPEIYCGNPRVNPDQSHCWVKIDGRFYDAFDPQGVDSEDELQWYQENVY